MHHQPLLITGVQSIYPDHLTADQWLLVEDGRIAAAGQGEAPSGEIHGIPLTGVRTCDFSGCYLAPGFIEIHAHGAGGCDFMDATPEAWRTIVRTHALHGTTALLATTLAAAPDETEQALAVWREWRENRPEADSEAGAAILGLHLEGPYFAYEQRGAQNPRFCRNPDPAEYKRLIRENPGILRWSAAPELPGALEFGQYAADHGILVSMAHTNALYPDVLAAMKNGYSLVTHLYSGMAGVTRIKGLRQGGLVESALLLDDLAVEVIADGCHLPVELLQLIFKCKGAAKIALISDAMRAAGQDVTTSILGSEKNGLPVIIQDNVAKLPDASALAGSIATGDRLLRTMHVLAGIPLPQVIAMLTRTPAELLGIQDRKGGLEVGMDADLVVLDADFHIRETFVGGRPISRTAVSG